MIKENLYKGGEAAVQSIDQTMIIDMEKAMERECDK